MFTLILIALVGAGYLHSRLSKGEAGKSRYELMLVYVLAGYCGVIMVGVSVWAIINPSAGADMLRTDSGSPFQDFFMIAYLGMSVMATLSIWIRGTYLIANVICWSIYWFGATYLHLADYQGAGLLSFENAVHILGAHALAPVLLVGLMGLWLYAGSGDAEGG